MCACLSPSLSLPVAMSLYEPMCVCVCALRSFFSVTELTRALGLDSRVRSITAPTHACLAGPAALPQAARPFISVSLTPADASSPCPQTAGVRAPLLLFKTFAFPREGKLVIKKDTKEALSLPPKSRAVKKTKVMIGWERGEGGGGGGGRTERARVVKSICTTTSYKMAK